MPRVDPHDLPVYCQKQRILDMVAENRVVVVESPTGSGKTTQLPVILHEAGYTAGGIIGVTQPRRIAALSVSEFIAAQLGVAMPDMVGYKMRFEDMTGPKTLIKIMTDGILLQELKLDPWLSKYSFIIVDEAHERSLNIDFVLGLLKRILAERENFRVIISSATINADVFSLYFDDCPVVNIETRTYPVTLVYDPPVLPPSAGSFSAEDAVLDKITDITERIVRDNDDKGGILAFLPGEKAIKNCIEKLSLQSWSRKLHILPLYGRLGKEEQERIFDPAPNGKRKMVVSTNIAETSVTINGITAVIDSGQAKLNFYNPRTYTSSLVETPVSKASCNQRKGRAGRTCAGICYRLYDRKDFEKRPMYTTEEIYRTDLSEVILRMAELGISDFEDFDFISPPGKEGIAGAVEILHLLEALDVNRNLTKTGEMMCKFPLLPRQSRMIVEALLRHPSVIEEVITAAAFMSVQSPFLLPPGKEIDARRAHHAFRDAAGDFASFLKIFRLYSMAKKKERFCKINFFDERILAEISNIKEQLECIVSETGVPITSGGTIREYLTCVAVGMIQFVCVKDGRGSYKTLTADRIQIHPGSCIYRENPQYIVAGEIVRTSRMYAMTVSPLTPEILSDINPKLQKILNASLKSAGKEKQQQKTQGAGGPGKSAKGSAEKTVRRQISPATISLSGFTFEVEKEKGKKIIVFPLDKLSAIARIQGKDSAKENELKGFRGKIITGKGALLEGMKLPLIFKAARELNLNPVSQEEWPRKINFNIHESIDPLVNALHCILRVTPAKDKNKTLGFITLYTDGEGVYWFKVSKGFHTAVNESLASMENLADETSGMKLPAGCKEKISGLYGKLHRFFSD